MKSDRFLKFKKYLRFMLRRNPQWGGGISPGWVQYLNLPKHGPRPSMGFGDLRLKRFKIPLVSVGCLDAVVLGLGALIRHSSHSST